METPIIVVVVVVGALVLFMLSRFGKDPSKKSNAQLKRELALHDRLISTTDVGTETYSKRIEDRDRVADELKRRIVGPEETSSPSWPDDTPTADQIRATVAAGYEEGWRRAKRDGNDDEEAQETALASGLLNRAVGIDGWPSISPDMMAAMMMESMPFKFAGSKDECRRALIECAVWRERPEEANATLVQQAVTALAERMKTSGDDGLLASFRDSPMAWAQLLPER